MAFLHTIESASLPGLSSIVMVFEPGTDILDARQVVEERLTQAHALPHVSKPAEMLQPLSSSSRVMMVALTSDELSPIDMSLIARWNIGAPIDGGPRRGQRVGLGPAGPAAAGAGRPARLARHGVSLQQMIETTRNAQFVLA